MLHLDTVRGTVPWLSAQSLCSISLLSAQPVIPKLGSGLCIGPCDKQNGPPHMRCRGAGARARAGPAARPGGTAASGCLLPEPPLHHAGRVGALCQHATALRRAICSPWPNCDAVRHVLGIKGWLALPARLLSAFVLLAGCLLRQGASNRSISITDKPR